MSKAEKPVLLIGAVARDTAEDVFRLVGPMVGDLAIGITDGEPGMRRFWILYIAETTWRPHPDMEMVREIREGVPGFPAYVPGGYHDFQWFVPKPGIEQLSPVETLGYPAEAAESYALFCRMQEEGVIPADARFQQCLPFPEDACRLVTNSADSLTMMIECYMDVLKRDVARLCELIPPERLVIQWDINWETVAIEHGDHLPDTPPMQFKAHGEPMERFRRYIRELNAAVPEAVKLGLHLCYGDLHHKHFKDPDDLLASVKMANAATEESPHAVDYVHMSVPRHRNDDKYFEPLADLHIGDTTIYAGLVHYTDGVQGTLKRLEVFQRHFKGSTGVATECGIGRRPPDQSMEVLLGIHRDAAAAIR
jgi:hypothetical protein